RPAVSVFLVRFSRPVREPVILLMPASVCCRPLISNWIPMCLVVMAYSSWITECCHCQLEKPNEKAGITRLFLTPSGAFPLASAERARRPYGSPGSLAFASPRCGYDEC